MGSLLMALNYAREQVYRALNAVYDVRTVCARNDIDLDARLPIRRRTRT